MKCPNCGSSDGFTRHFAGIQDMETGYVDSDYLTCNDCGSKTDDEELKRLEKPEPEFVMSATERDLMVSILTQAMLDFNADAESRTRSGLRSVGYIVASLNDLRKLEDTETK